MLNNTKIKYTDILRACRREIFGRLFVCQASPYQLGGKVHCGYSEYANDKLALKELIEKSDLKKTEAKFLYEEYELHDVILFE